MVTGALSGSAGGVKTRIVIMLRRTATRGRRNKMAVSLCRAISECPLKIPEQPEIIVATEGE
jgi:hypothetical protein